MSLKRMVENLSLIFLNISALHYYFLRPQRGLSGSSYVVFPSRRSSRVKLSLGSLKSMTSPTTSARGFSNGRILWCRYAQITRLEFIYSLTQLGFHGCLPIKMQTPCIATTDMAKQFMMRGFSNGLALKRRCL